MLEQTKINEESYKLLIESVKDYAILMTDPEGYIISWNKGAEKIKGYTADEIIGQHISLFYTADEIESGEPEKNLQRAKESGRFEDEGWRVRKNGSTFWANVVITALKDNEGTLVGFGKVTRDLTKRKSAEEEIKQLNTQLETELQKKQVRNICLQTCP